MRCHFLIGIKCALLTFLSLVWNWAHLLYMLYKTEHTCAAVLRRSVQVYVGIWERLFGYPHRAGCKAKGRHQVYICFYFFHQDMQLIFLFRLDYVPHSNHNKLKKRKKIAMHSLSTPRRTKWATYIFLYSPHKIPRSTTECSA